MTEAEAKQKWCPFARAPGYHMAYNRSEQSGGPSESARCLGSGCMAWRAEHALDPKGKLLTRGYCGLAGKP